MPLGPWRDEAEMEAARDLVEGGGWVGGATDEAEVISMVRKAGVRWR